MISAELLPRLTRRLPVLHNAGPAFQHELLRHATLARIPAGQDVFAEGDPVEALALLVSGVVRVYKIAETGREITLYRFGLGESCILTANAILSRSTFPALATVEQDVEAVLPHHPPGNRRRAGQLARSHQPLAGRPGRPGFAAPGARQDRNFG